MPDAASRLQVHLFGPLQVRVGGDPLPPLRSRKGGWLLALLALRAGREVRREWLAETLWPDSMPDEALGSLRQSLSDLRRALGEHAARLTSPTSRTLRLELAEAEADVAAFDAAVRRGDPDSLAWAVELYRGPLLEGCLEVWVLPEREERQEAYLRALEALAARAEADGDLPEALRLLRLAAADDPLRESAVRALMAALARSGERQAAVEAYQTLRRRLFQEHSAEPDPETTALFRSLRGGQRLGSEFPIPSSQFPIRSGASRSAAPNPQSATRNPQSEQSAIPWPLTRLIGRERELGEVEAALLTGRLVTLTGIGGVGKTRLALEAAHRAAEEFPDGACFVDLAPLSDLALVPQAAAAALGMEADAGPVLSALQSHLRARQFLMVLDNCEHLVEGCAEMARALLTACPGVRILATSRERLGLTGERVLPMPPLGLGVRPWEGEAPAEPVPAPTPGSPGALPSRASAEVLFEERAGAVAPGFVLTEANAGAVGRICRRLDGIPLAIELAAALVEALSVDEIAARLDDRFRLLTGGDRTRPPRHRTLRAAVDWSYDLLSEPERALLRRLSVFAGSFDLEAAACVAEGAGPGGRRPDLFPLLRQLVVKSLVTPEAVREPGTDPGRYRMLETIREYAGERLAEAGEEARARNAHLRYYLRLAEDAEPRLTGPGQQASLARLDADADNLRAAMDWALAETHAEARGTEEERLQAGLRIAVALGRYWQIRGYFTEGRLRLRQALSRADSANEQSRSQKPEAKITSWAAFLAVHQGDYAEARALAERSLALWREIGDAAGAAGALGVLGICEKDSGNPGRGEELLREALALQREAGDAAGVASTLGYLGIVAAGQGDRDAARLHYTESLALRRELEDCWGIAASLNNLGLLALAVGDAGAARPLLEESLALRRRIGDRRCVAVTLNNLGVVAIGQGEPGVARELLQESLRLAREIGDRRSVAYSLEAFARLAGAAGLWDRAARLLGAAAALREAIGAPLPPVDHVGLDALVNAAREALVGGYDGALEAGRALVRQMGGVPALEDAVGFALESEGFRERRSREPAGTARLPSSP